MKRNAGLDFVRSFAILSVLGCHFGAFYGWAPRYITYPFGCLGVEVFFVLSGYLVGGIFLRDVARNSGRVTPALIGEFWARRWLRTVPNYLLFLGVALWLRDSLGRPSLVYYITFTQNFTSPMPSFYHESWSLAIEEWFYLLLPTLTYALYKIFGRSRTALLGAAALLIAVPIMLRSIGSPGHHWDGHTRKVLVMHTDVIMWGVFVAALERYRPALFRRLQASRYFAAGSFLVVITVVYLGLRYRQGDSGDFIATKWDALIFPAFGLACATALPFCSGLSRSRPTITWLGCRISTCSYSIYLCHVPAMFVTRIIFGHLLLGFAHFEPAIALVTVFIVSTLLYRYFEHPIMRLRDRIFVTVHGASRFGSSEAVA